MKKVAQLAAVTLMLSSCNFGAMNGKVAESKVATAAATDMSSLGFAKDGVPPELRALLDDCVRSLGLGLALGDRLFSYRKFDLSSLATASIKLSNADSLQVVHFKGIDRSEFSLKIVGDAQAKVCAVFSDHKDKVIVDVVLSGQNSHSLLALNEENSGSIEAVVQGASRLPIDSHTVLSVTRFIPAEYVTDGK